jgi:ADP-heptose:LPS heptosyltransferase
MMSRTLRLARAMRGLRADALAILQPDRTIEFAGLLAGVRIRAGFARARCWPQFLTSAAPYRKSEGAKHEGLYNFDVLGMLSVPEPARLEPALSPDPEGAARLAHRTGFEAARWKSCAVLHLAAHGAKPRVPLGAFASLAGWLKREPGLRPVLIGTETDPPVATIADAAGMAADEFIDLRGVTDLAETAWLLRHAALCVGRDSGPVHLAAAMGCPTLALFADSRPILGPTRWRPLGPRVEVLPAETSTDFEAVRAAAARLLKGSG